MIDINKRWMIALIVFLSFIPIVSAPIWYGSGDDTGLVGRWSCEGNFLDASGQGNDGTQSGGVTITNGVKGRACGFDGVDDYVTIADDSSLDILTEITVCAWTKTKQVDLLKEIVRKEQTQRLLLSFQATANCAEGNEEGCIAFGLYAGSYAELEYNTSVADFVDKWKHICGKHIDGDGSYIYVDGQQVAYRADADLLNISGTGTVLIGSYVATGEFFNGSIDEIRIYNRSLSAAEVSALYDTQKSYKIVLKTTPTLGLLDDTPAPTLTDESGLVGHWKMDSATGETTDSSGNGHTLTSAGADSSEGRWNEGYLFSTQSDRITADNDAAWNLNETNHTFSGWYKYDNTSYSASYYILRRFVGGTPGAGFLIAVSNTTKKLIVNERAVSDAIYISETEVEDGKWHHFAFVVNVNGGSGDGYLYRDGVLVRNDSFSGGLINYGSALYIGGDNLGIYGFSGNIDEIRIYNRSLSADEVKELYLSKGLLMHYKFDTGLVNSTHALDSSGYNHHIPSVKTVLQTNLGRFKEGIDFRASNDESYFYDNVGWNVSKFSFSLWYKEPEVPVSQAHLVAMQLVGGYNYEAIRVGFYNNSFRLAMSNDYALSDIVTSVDEGDKSWHHLTITYNDTGCMYAYLDGGAVVSSDCGLTPFDNLLDNLWIGQYSSGTYNYNGFLDDFRFYNRILSASEVAGLYNGTKSNKIVLKTTPTLGLLNDTPAPTISSETGLVGHWKLDGDATDSSGEGNDGTVTGATSTSAGRWNEAYSFDGSNDYIQVSDDVSLRFETNNFTVSVWFKWEGPINNGYLITKNTYSLPDKWSIDANIDSTLRTGFRYNDSKKLGTLTALEIGKWYNAVFVREGDVGKAYLDGALKNTDNFFFIGANFSNDNSLLIGARVGPAVFFNGSIDEVRIYNRSLSADEVKELYLSKGLVGHWKMDASTRNTTDTFDSSGYNNHGKITGAVQTNEGRFKEAMKFDGVNDLINTTGTNLTSNLTISAWIKTTGNQDNNAHGIVSWGESSNGKRRSLIIWNGGSGTDYNFWFSGYAAAANLDSGVTITDGNWYHLVATVNASNFTTVYVNGALKNSAQRTLIPYTYTSTLIGRSQVSNEWYNGTIDEVRIYNRALTATEVSQLYNGTQTSHIRLKSVAG